MLIPGGNKEKYGMAAADRWGEVENFDDWSQSYDGSVGQIFFTRVHKAVLDMAVADSEGIAPTSILDIGCATGRLLRSAGRLWPKARLLGVDPSEGMIEAARGLEKKATFMVGLAAALPLPDSSVDLVVSTLSFHHWDDPMGGLREIRRVLKPGGRFCLADVNLPRILTKVISHFGSRTAEDLRSMLERAGLHVALKRRAVAYTVLALLARRK
jgi:ubiquinone/menaquinone biosynthesis C-methylase UbiE